MHTEFASSFQAPNPFAAFLSPEVVLAARDRLSARVRGVVHRPLDKPTLPKAGNEILALVDAEVDAEPDLTVDADESEMPEFARP